MTKIICPSCGKRLSVSEKWSSATCSGCGAELTRDVCANEGQRWKEKQPHPFMPVSWRIAIIVALAAVIGVAIHAQLASGRYDMGNPGNDDSIISAELPSLDPFNGIDLRFEGGSGDGTARVLGGHSGVRYNVTPCFGLKNGDTVAVDAESWTYRLTTEKKLYVVSSLDNYLENPAELSENALWKLERTSIQTLQNEFNGMGIVDKWKDSLGEPVRKAIYVLPTGTSNTVYDVFWAPWQLADGTELDVYLAAEYERLVVRDLPDGDATLDYAFVTTAGPLRLADEAGVPHANENRGIQGYWTLEQLQEDLLGTQPGCAQTMSREFG